MSVKRNVSHAMTTRISAVDTEVRADPQHLETSVNRDQIAFWLGILMLLILPIERVILPSGLRVVDFVLILLSIYSVIKAWRVRQRFVFPLFMPIWLILLSSSLATLSGIAVGDSIIAIVQEIYLFVWFVCVTNALCVFSLPDLDRLMKVWSVVACAEAVTTVMGMLRIGPSMFYTLPYRDRYLREGLVRAVGTYVNPNAVAVYLSVSFFVVLATSWPIWLRFVLGAWIFVGMFGTGSNGALMTTLGGLAVLIGLYSTVKNRRETVLWGAVAGIGTGIVAAAFLSLVLFLSPESGLDFGGLLFMTLGRLSSSLSRRIDLVGFAWKAYIRHPWGTGPNSFATLNASLHNDYAAFWFERGPLGLIGWLLLVASACWSALRTANQLVDKRRRWPVLALGAGMLACAVNAFSHEISHMRQVWMLLAFLFAASYAGLARQNRSSDVVRR
ncbi:MAG: O-antigen ligase family protein [Anaerolineae bacterium]|nr:O-antigen ligase family protein [Anaerolineae bacterium]